MAKEPEFYNVWTDGSYRNETVGAAWKIAYAGESTTDSTSFTKLHEKDRPRGSDIAELTAVTSALKRIPDGAYVLMRLDAQPIIDMLNDKKIPGKASNIPAGVAAAFEKAVIEMSRLGSCRITKVSDRTNADMQDVNRLARTASGKASRELLRRDL